MWLRELCQMSGVSGDESPVREIVQRAMAGLADQQQVDALGNLIVRKEGTRQSELVVMVAAHMDEVGLMITQVEGSGFLRFRPVGGIDARILPSKAVLVGKDRVPGVIGVKPVHRLEPEEREKVVKIEQMHIDIAAGTKEEAERLVKVGDYACFAPNYEEIEREGQPFAIKSKALDDRAGCSVLIEVLAERYPFDLYGVFTVQEEVGLRGARVAAYRLAPDFGFALEGTVCDDLPSRRDVSPTTRLGKGPAITIMDRSFVADKRLVRLLVQTAEEEGIPYQIKQPGVGGTDAGAMQQSRGGVPSATVAVPCRYIHSPVGILQLSDYHHTVALMVAALKRLPSLAG